MPKKNGKRTLNVKEQTLISALGDDKEHSIKELKMLYLHDAAARLAAHYKGGTKKDADFMAQSCVRNSLRRLVALELVVQVGRGTYKRTDKAAKIFGQAA